MNNKNKISEAELEVIKVLWDRKDSMVAIEIFEDLNQKIGWEDSTVRTLIRRLTQKGFLIKEKKEKCRREVYYYVPFISEDEYMKEKQENL